jgi:hypothetical protein
LDDLLYKVMLTNDKGVALKNFEVRIQEGISLKLALGLKLDSRSATASANAGSMPDMRPVVHVAYSSHEQNQGTSTTPPILQPP